MFHRHLQRSLILSLAALFTPAAVQAQRVDVLEAAGMVVTGYADPISVEPGETVRFMISSSAPTYRADLVRLIHGFEGDRGPGFQEEVIPSSINKEFPGRLQTWDSGSYVWVGDHEALRLSGSFTLQAWIYPTLPHKGVQGILTKWNQDSGSYALVIDDDGSIGLWLRDSGGKTERIRTGAKLPATQPVNGSHQGNDWYFVAAVYDQDRSRVTLYQQPLRRWPGDSSGTVVSREVSVTKIRSGDAPFLIGGIHLSGPPQTTVVSNFNGKIENPRVFTSALSAEEIEVLKSNGLLSGQRGRLAASWDFSREISSDRVLDTSQNRLHGRAVNRPKRAVTSHTWNGRTIDFKESPQLYAAIHFHDDDLEKAGWESDCDLKIPEDARSGFYAARLRAAGGEDYLPFFIRPARDRPKAGIAFLAPTFTYLAYANIGNACENCRQASSLGLYSRHSDGSGVFYSSHLRPILDMRPKAVTRWGAGGSTPRHYSGDLSLIAWLESKGFEYEVITDHDLHREGQSLLSPYRVVITGSHPEYYSERMLDALQDYLEGGGRMMYLGGNGFYWVTSVAPDNPDTVEVRKWGGTQGYEAAPGEWYHSTSGELGGIWRFRGRPPQELVGIGFSALGFDKNAPYQRESGSFHAKAAFIFEGIGPSELIGDFDTAAGMGRGAAGDELDRLDFGLGSPSQTIVLATARDFSTFYHVASEEIMELNLGMVEGGYEKIRADMVYLQYPNGGAVFSAGSIGWIGSLSANNSTNNVSRITENVLRRFHSAEPLP